VWGQPRVKRDGLCQWQRAIFDRPTESKETSLDRSPIIIASDYVGDPQGCAKFGANPSTGGGLLGEWIKYNKKFIYSFIPFFRNSTSGQSHRRFFTLDGSNDADSRKGCHLGVSLGEIPPKPNFLAVNGRFQAKRAKY